MFILFLHFRISELEVLHFSPQMVSSRCRMFTLSLLVSHSFPYETFQEQAGFKFALSLVSFFITGFKFDMFQHFSYCSLHSVLSKDANQAILVSTENERVISNPGYPGPLTLLFEPFFSAFSRLNHQPLAQFSLIPNYNIFYVVINQLDMYFLWIIKFVSPILSFLNLKKVLSIWFLNYMFIFLLLFVII